MYKLFREPQPGEVVIIGADPADGGSNYCAAHCISKKMADDFMVFHARMESSQFGHELYKMAKYIHRMTGEYPVIAVERNVGMATISTLQNYNYPRLFRMPKIGSIDATDIADRIGFTTNSSTRPMILDSLALALKQKALRIYDEETVKELMSFVRNDRTGKPEAATGSFDDLVMSLAITWFLFGNSPVVTKEGMSAKIAQFPKQDLFDDTGAPNY